MKTQDIIPVVKAAKKIMVAVSNRNDTFYVQATKTTVLGMLRGRKDEETGFYVTYALESDTSVIYLDAE
jgi:hypothetical protein